MAADDDEESGEKFHDFGPWIEAPNSTRVSKYRYDYGEGELQVEWQNGKGHVCTSYKLANRSSDPTVQSYGATTYRKFAIAVSKGKYVNSTLNGFKVRSLKNSDEKDLPSNPDRRAVKFREQGASVIW